LNPKTLQIEKKNRKGGSFLSERGVSWKKCTKERVPCALQGKAGKKKNDAL